MGRKVLHGLVFIVRMKDRTFVADGATYGTFTKYLASAKFYTRPLPAEERVWQLEKLFPREEFRVVDVALPIDELVDKEGVIEEPEWKPADPPPAILSVADGG